MDLEEMKFKVDTYYGVDTASKSRVSPHTDARKLLIFMARSANLNGGKGKYVYQEIGNLINRNHDTCIYHYKVAKQWFDAGDHEFNRDLFAVFGVSNKSKEARRLDRLRLAYDSLLLSIPEGMHDEIMETITLKINARKWKSKNEYEVITSTDSISESIW